MPTPAHSSTNNPTGSRQRRLIIVARSANLLARAAASGGFRPIVVDAYGDIDTRSIAIDYRRLKYIGQRIEFVSLCESLADINASHGELPILWGGGWESSGHLLYALGMKHQILGSHPLALIRLSKPNWYERLYSDKQQDGRVEETNTSAESNFPYFAPSVFAKQNHQALLIKSRQRSGGHAVREAGSERFLRSSEFFQPLLAGRSISALCLADGCEVKILGWSVHFKLQDNPHSQFRHSAAVTIPPPSPSAALLLSLQRAMKYLGLFGVFGCDFIETDNGQLKLVDLNPRITATAPLHIAQQKLLMLHLSPSNKVEKRSSAAASAVIYADIPLRITKTLDWPPWASDIPPELRIYHSAEPLCTIHSCGKNTEAAKDLLIERYSELMARLIKQVR